MPALAGESGPFGFLKIAEQHCAETTEGYAEEIYFCIITYVAK